MACRKCGADGKRIRPPKIVFDRGIKNPRTVETPRDRKKKCLRC